MIWWFGVGMQERANKNIKKPVEMYIKNLTSKILLYIILLFTHYSIMTEIPSSKQWKYNLLSSMAIKVAFSLMVLLGAVDNKSHAQSVKQTLSSWSNNAEYHYDVCFDYLDKLDWNRAYENRTQSMQWRAVRDILTYPNVFNITAAKKVEVKGKDMFLASVGMNQDKRVIEQEIIPMYYIDIPVNQQARKAIAWDTTHAKYKDFILHIANLRTFNEGGDAPKVIRLRYYKWPFDTHISNLQSMPYTLFGESYGNTDGVNWSKALCIKPEISLPPKSRKYFVAYGREVNHDACKPWDHHGSGHQSQYCGKTNVTKSYHREGTGKQLTAQEVEKYVKNKEISIIPDSLVQWQ